MSFVFYDTETTGLDPFFDQILQFAAVKTDENLAETDRIDIRCRLRPHIVPSPKALCITGISVAQLIDTSLPSHYEMMKVVKAKFDCWSPSLFIGWNSIRFDEALIRQALYQTLHQPYITNTNGNCRTDAMRIVQASSVFSPGNIKVPTNYKGRQSFKLDEIAALNGFPQHQAHDAIGDIEATIHMCALIKNYLPDLWSNLVRFSQKSAVLSFVFEEFVFSLTDFYSNGPYSRLVTALGQRADNSSEVYVFDLQHSPKELDGLSEAALKVRLQSSPKPVVVLKANAAPIIADEDECPTALADRLPCKQEAFRRAKFLGNNPTLKRRLIKLAEELRTQYPAAQHVETKIYDSFVGDADWELAAKFHAATWNQRRKIIPSFGDDRLRDLGKRLLYEETPNLLGARLRADMEKTVKTRLLGLDGLDAPWRTVPQAIEEVNDMLDRTGEYEKGQLNSIKEFLEVKLDDLVN